MRRILLFPLLLALCTGCARKPAAQDAFVYGGTPLVRDCYTADPAPRVVLNSNK